MTVNNFDVIKEMTARNSRTLHAYPIDNVEDVKIGKDGWGHIRVAISNDDCNKLIAKFTGSDESVRFYLMIWDGKEFDQIKKELEK